MVNTSGLMVGYFFGIDSHWLTINNRDLQLELMVQWFMINWLYNHMSFHNGELIGLFMSCRIVNQHFIVDGWKGETTLNNSS
jgi:hypothetical protein